MYVGRTSETVLKMSDFSDFHNALNELVRKFDEVQLKIESDDDNDIIKVFGERFTSLSRAKNGLSDVTELSLTTAEHHPYWNLLYQCCQICSTALDNWTDELSKEDIDEIKWSISELDNTCKKLQDKIIGKDK